MAANRRRHTNSVPVAGIVKWIIVALFLGIAGLSYVYFKNQQHTTGNDIKSLERQLADLIGQNDVACARISQLSSRSYLQKRLSEGFIHMVPITDDRIVRITTAPQQHIAANELRAVANQTLEK